MGAEDDAIVAEIALRKRWIDRSQLQRALEVQSAAAAIGLDERLLDILLTKGFITDRQGRELEDDLGLGRLVQPEHRDDIQGYGIVERLGQGGMGAVFRAVQLSMDRAVALKVLSPQLSRDASFVQRFLREARAIGRVSHPNVVGGLDSGRSGDYYYYSMELVEGRNLYDTLRDGPLPVLKVIGVAAQMARALVHVESLGLVHRDIKPSNIIVTAEGVAKLCDLGLARSPGDPSVTDTGIPIGTPHYASPEQATGAKVVDVRSDIYSLGATLYHLLTGEFPFKATTSAELLLKHVEEELRPPIELRPDVPRPLSNLICRMMAKRPDDRFQDAAELLEAVEALQAERAAVQSRDEPAAAAPLPKIAPPPPVAEPAPAVLPTIAPPAEPEAQPGTRLLANLAWGAVFAILLGLLAMAVVWAVRMRSRPSASRKPEGLSHPAATSAQGGGPLPKGKPEEGELPQEDAAKRLAENALAFDREHPEAYGAALLELRRASLAVRGSPLAAQAEARLAARSDEFRRTASRAYAELGAKVQSLIQRDQFGDALRAYAGFPAKLRYGAWDEQVRWDMAAIGGGAEFRYLELAAGGERALTEQRFEDAFESYRKITELGVPWIARQGASLLASAKRYAEAERQRLEEAAKRGAVAERRRAPGRLTALFTSVVDEARRHQYAKALELCQAAPEALRQGEFGAALAQLESRVRGVRDLWDAALLGPEAARKKPFVLHGNEGTIAGFDGPEENRQIVIVIGSGASQRTLKQAVRRLPAPQMFQLVQWAAEPETAASALKLGLFYLAEGKPSDARRKLEAAGKLGADVAACLKEVDAEELLARAFDAHGGKDWAKARQLIEAALDGYPASLPVILNHPRLMRALDQCLAQLGEAPLPPSPFTLHPPRSTASPVPIELRRLLLLPETRLGTAPPADVAAAYLAEPLERTSPLVLGLPQWGDYTIALQWTAKRASQSSGGKPDLPPLLRLVLLFRLSEPLPGQFAYYYLAVDGDRLTLGRCVPDGRTELASQRCPALAERRPHRLLLSARGSELKADLDGTDHIEATDAALVRGNIGLTAADEPILINELSVVLPATELRPGASTPRQ